MRVSNVSHSQHVVHMHTRAAPAGWTALGISDPVLTLSPGESADFSVQVERMIVADVDPDPLTFSVRASTPASRVSDVHASFQVIAREVRGRGPRPKRPELIVV